VVVTEDRNSLAFGWDKRGQLGSGLVRNGMFFQLSIKFCSFLLIYFKLHPLFA